MVKLRDTKPDGGSNENGERLGSLDAVRGVFLLLIVGAGFGLRDPSMINQERWGWLTNQWTHRPSEGCTLFDLVQPAFLFLVGIAMPYSYANRQAKGQNWIRQAAHAVKRSALLILIGVYLDGYHAQRPLWDDPWRWFELRGCLQQIGLAYLIAFLVLPMGKIAQGMSVAFLLVGSTAGYVIYAMSGGHQFWGDANHLGVAVDQWLHFAEHSDHVVTFNVLPSAAIVLLGALVGGMIQSGLTSGTKVAVMTACSFVAIFLGWVLSGGGGWIDFQWFAVVPMVRRLMTLTFVFTSVGWTLLLFTYFYLLIDGFFMKAVAVPFAVLGRNSLFVFVTYTLFHDWAESSAVLVLPSAPSAIATLRPFFISLIVLAIYWLVCLWLYCRRIYFKV